MLSAIAEGHVPHACFISCSDLLMAETIAKRAAAMYCTGKPDPALINGSNCLIPPNFKIDSIREIIAELSKSSFSGGKRAVLLINAHNMLESAQNALLKTLEEPPKDVLFLLTGNDAGLLPTILSRCAAILCGSPDIDDIARELSALGASGQEARLYAAAGATLECGAKLYRDESYRQLRKESQDVLIELLKGKLPFDRQKAVASKDGAKFMLSFMGDILNYKTRGRIIYNPDRENDIAAISPRFTQGKINGIIEALAEAMDRLSTPASPSAAFTRLFTEIAEEFNI